jgi:hypothetical protein
MKLNELCRIRDALETIIKSKYTHLTPNENIVLWSIDERITTEIETIEKDNHTLLI